MFSFTRKTDYALVALSRLARSSSDGSEAVSARQIADEYGTPLSLLMNVLKDLQQAGIIGSTRGSRGGYFLQRPADRITFACIIEAIDKPVGLTACCTPTDSPQCNTTQGDDCAPCQIMPNCPVGRSIRKVNQHVTDYLARITLDDLIHGRIEPIVPETEMLAR